MPAPSHRMTHTPFYNTWVGMRSRCNNPSSKDFKNYGARGIKVCDRWVNSFENFRDDMLGSYAVSLSLDRINNEGNYCMDNCRWTTKLIQNNNTRMNRVVEFNGIKKTLSQWSESLKIKRTTLRMRLDAYGWSVEKSFLTI